MKAEQPYIHALGHAALTRFYDPLMRVLFAERAFKESLISLADIRPGHRVLDVGAGTGTLAILIKQRIPKAVVVGIDGDPAILDIARGKVAAAGVDVELRQALAQRLPFSDASFDRVVTSLVVHHITDKEAAFREMARVLRPGGELHVADFGPPRTAPGRLAARVALHFEHVADNLTGRLPDQMRAAGFVDVEEVPRFPILFGLMRLDHLRGRKPGSTGGVAGGWGSRQ